MLNFKEKGITLIALIVTIIVLIILAGISINALLGDNGIVTQARWSGFVAEMTGISEQVKLEQQAKAMEIYEQQNVGNIENQINAMLFTIKYNESDLSDTLKNEVIGLEGDTNNLYQIKLDNVKENTYLYEPTIKVIFKIKGINIFGKTLHSIDAKDMNKEPEEEVVIEMNPTYTNGYYEPNLDGFDPDNTYIIYYSSDYTETKAMTAREYIEAGKPQTITESDKTYTFYDYKNTTNAAKTSTWANVMTKANGLEAWWVWIPRYSYNTTNISTKTGFDIKFTTVNNEIIDLDGNVLGIVGQADFENYIPHEGFTQKYTDAEGNVQIAKELTGIWMSKYEPSETTNFENNQETLCYGPNLEGYDVNNTYIVTYDKDGTAEKNQYKLADILKPGYIATTHGSLVSGQIDMTKIPADEVWYDYGNQIWGNIVTKANGIEACWVWIPRYAYNIEGQYTGTGVVFVNTDNNPFVGELNTPLNEMVVNSGFDIMQEDGTIKKLKGIWMSKYEPSETTTIENTLCYAPNLEGFDINHTYIVTYDETASQEKNQYRLVDVLKSGYTATEKGSLISGEIDMTKIPSDEVWYDYGKQIWGNIVTKANGLEAWWVWIPRYAYNLEGTATGFAVVFVDTDNKPFIGELNAPLMNIEVHPGFDLTEEDGSITKLKGIWMSKYEPSEVDDVISGSVASGNTDLPYADDTAGNNHEHVANGSGTVQRYVTSSTSWCSAYNGTPCSNYGYYIYCSECGVRLRHYWCANHYNPDTKVIINDENIE